MKKSPDAHIPVVGQIGYKVSLLQVKPGREISVGKKLGDAILEHTGSPPICMLKLFGKYDLCTIYKFNTHDFFGGPSKAGPIDGIRGSNSILAFHWRSHDVGDNLSIGRKKGDVWGVLFFRFNEVLCHEFGAQIEEVLVRHWHEEQPQDVALDILGTTGWAELLFLIRGQKFDSVTSALTRISQQVVRITRNNHIEETDLFSAKTFSLLGVTLDITAPSQRKQLKHSLNEKFKFGHGVFPILNITCPPGSMKKVYGYVSAEDRFGPGSTFFGSKDLVISPQAGTWGTFIAKILSMRRSLSRYLYSTAVDILQAPPSPFENFEPRLLKKPGLRIPPTLYELFQKWGPKFENRLTNLYFGLTNMMQDPLIGDCFAELRPIVTQRLPLLLRKADPNDIDAKRFLWSVIDSIAYGAEERAHGAFLAIEHVKGSLSPTKGGIQRILKAVSSIPNTLLKRVGKRWYGFVVAGFQNEGWASWYEIINLPYNYLFSPEEWWGLFHETGHAAFWDTKYIDLVEDKRIKQVVKRNLPAGEVGEGFWKWRLRLWEVGADLFALYFCYGLDFDFYIGNIFTYIVDNGKPLTKKHFVRYFVVFMYWKYLLLQHCKHFPRQLNFESDIRIYQEKLASLGFHIRYKSHTAEEAQFSFINFRDIIEIYHDRYQKDAPIRNLEQEFQSEPMVKLVNMVLRGQISQDPIEKPDVFVLALKKRQNELSLSARIAAILSLWHTAMVV